jgi:hypothetical protein
MENLTISTLSSDTRTLYRLGGVSAFIFGIGYLVIISLYVPLERLQPGSDIELRLINLAENVTVWWGILGVSVLTDILYIPIAIALYFVLRDINRGMMVIAIACIGLFVILELSITWMNYAALLNLGSNYLATTDAVKREAIVTSANYPFAVLDAHHLLGIYTILMNAIGVFITGLVMLKGIFSRLTAWLALVSSTLTVIAIVGTPIIGSLWITMIVGSLLIGVWVILVGYKLLKLGKSIA